MPTKTTKNAEKINEMDAARWLAAALPHVPAHGWEPVILAKAAKNLGFDSALAAVVFPRGITDVIIAFHDSTDAQMEEALNTRDGFAQLKIRQKITVAVRTRLEILAPYKTAVRKLLGWAAMPLHAPLALKLLWVTCDKIWWLAGDTATDYNHYTKRLLLAQVWQRTLLFWLHDTSRGQVATWDYLDERIEEVLQMGKNIGQLKDMAGMAGNFLKKWKAAA